MKVTNVSDGTLIKRLNRKLRYKGLSVKAYIGGQWLSELGNYYAVDDNNNIVCCHIDLNQWGRDYGCLCSNEVLAVM